MDHGDRHPQVDRLVAGGNQRRIARRLQLVLLTRLPEFRTFTSSSSRWRCWHRRLLAAPRPRRVLSLAGWFVLQSLTGTYVMVFTSLSLVAAALARPSDWIGKRFPRASVHLAAAAVVSALALAPFLLPYYHSNAEVGLGRSLEETRRYSAELTDYFAAAGRIHFDMLKWSRPYFQGDALFPGFVGLTLAVIGIAASGIRDARARMLLAIAGRC